MRRAPFLLLSLMVSALAAPACKDTAEPPIVQSTTARVVAERGADPTVPLAEGVSTPAWGAREPLVVVTVFEDFQCPFCRGVGALLDRIVRAWPDDVQVQFRNLPLNFHRLADVTARAAMAAHQQGRFKAYADVLFDQQRRWSRGPGGRPAQDGPELREWLVELAEELGLDRERFEQDLESEAVAAKIRQDLGKAGLVGANGTPTILISGRKTPSRSFEDISAAIEADLRAARILMDRGVSRSEVVYRVTAGRVQDPKVVDWLLHDDPIEADKLDEAAGKLQQRTAPEPVAETVWRVPAPETSPVRGAEDALVTVVIFSEFQCPFCSRAVEPLEQLVEAYPKELRLVFRNLPLPFHEHAESAAVAAMCGHEQGKFWEFHDELFDNQRRLGDELYEEIAGKAGVDMAAWKKCVASGKPKALIEADKAAAQEVGVGGTPNIFINGRRIRGARPFSDLKTIVDEEIVKARALSEGAGRGPKLYEAIVGRGKTETPLEDGVAELDLSGAPRLGKADAPVKVAVFSDFQCPFCKRVAPGLEELAKKLPDDVAVYFKHFPLSFHQSAEPAAIASICAQKQDKFWPFHDQLFSDPSKLTDDGIDEAARHVGLDIKAFEACREDPATKARVEADIAEGKRIGVRGTPTILFNGRKYNSRYGVDGGALARVAAQLER